MRYRSLLHAAVAASLLASAWAQDVAIRVTGRVVDPDGKAVPGATLQTGLMHEVGLRGVRVACKDDGRFEATIRVPWRSMRTAHAGVLVSAPGRASLRQGWNEGPFDAITGQPARYDRSMGVIVMNPGRELRGRVLGQRKTQIVGARIRVMPLLDCGGYFWNRLSGYAIAETDEEGRFRLEGAARGPVSLMVDADGHYDRIINDVDGKDLEIKMRPSGHIAGKLLAADGKATQGCIFVDYEGYMLGVSAEGQSRRTRQDSLMPCQVVESGADGRFAVTLRYPGFFRVRARGSHAWHEVVEKRVRNSAVSGLELRLPAESARFVRVRATDAETGAAIKSFWGASYWHDDPHRQFKHPIVALAATYERATSHDAVLLLPGPAQERSESGMLHVVAKGYAPAFLGPFDFAKKREASLSLVAESTIEGRLLGPPEAVGGVSLTCRAVMSKTDRSLGNYMPALETRTRRDGSFRFSGLWAGRFDLGTTPHGWAKPVKVSLERGEHKTGVVIGTAPRIPIVGTLRGELPAGSALVLSRGSAASNRWFRLFAVSSVSTDGRFAFPAQPAGDYRLALRIHDPMRPQWPLEHELQNSKLEDKAPTLELTLPGSLLARVKGRLISEAAQGKMHRFVVAAVDVKSARPLFKPDARNYAAGARCSSLSDKGEFELRLLPAKYRLELIDLVGGLVLHRSDPVELAAGTDHVHDLRLLLERVRLVLRGPDERRAECASIQIRLPEVSLSTAKTPRLPIRPKNYLSLWVGDRPGRIDLILPRGPVEVSAVSQLSWLFPNFKAGVPSKLGEREFTVTEEGPASVLLVTSGVSSHEWLETRAWR